MALFTIISSHLNVMFGHNDKRVNFGPFSYSYTPTSLKGFLKIHLSDPYDFSKAVSGIILGNLRLLVLFL